MDGSMDKVAMANMLRNPMTSPVAKKLKRKADRVHAGLADIQKG